jgi:hypothetical protein
MRTHAPALPTADLASHLSGPPGSKVRFGVTAAEVLQTCFLVSAAQESWDKGTILTFLEQEDLNPKVWDKLVAIARSKNLQGLPKKSLPASYTALYALVVMKAEELKAAGAEGVIGPDVSSRSILDWTKAYRLKITGIEQEMPLTLVLKEALSSEQHQDLLDALKVTAERFGAEVRAGKSSLKQTEVKAEARKVLAVQIEEELMQEIGQVVASAPVDLKSRFGIRSAADLLEGPKATFTGFFQNLVGKVKIEFWRQFGRAYLLKIARDFNLTDSRAERFQYKKRIADAVKNWGPQVAGFDAMADEILTTYMSK